MDSASQALFGRFPRFVGNPRQFAVNSPEEFDVFVDSNDGSENVYASISASSKSGVPVTDMVSLDFDSPMKEAAFEPELRDDQKLARMHEDDRLLREVLGDVFEDVQRVCEWAIEHSTPGVCVLTGFGIHVHLLYEPMANAAEHLTSIAVHLKEELDLDTIDRLPIGDLQRLVRVPNCQRMAGEFPCEHICIPIRARALPGYDLQDFFALSLSRHSIETGDIDAARSPMPLFEKYTSPSKREEDSDGSIRRQPIESSPQSFEDGFLADYLKDLLKMPCLWQRLLQPDPCQMIRFAATVQLFNCGLSPEEVRDIYGRLGWIDYDAELTKQQVEQIYRTGYSSMSCESMMEHGLCCYPVDEAEGECPTHGWQGGLRNY
jgi:hypothetical protein